jgi:hypothetical protein
LNQLTNLTFEELPLFLQNLLYDKRYNDFYVGLTETKETGYILIGYLGKLVYYMKDTGNNVPTENIINEAVNVGTAIVETAVSKKPFLISILPQLLLSIKNLFGGKK